MVVRHLSFPHPGEGHMPEIKLKIDDLVLDHDNPRITHAEGQQEALQKIVKDQQTKLVKLAESIVERGLNPMDRLLVLRLTQAQPRFMDLERNRSVAELQLLPNHHVLSRHQFTSTTKKAHEKTRE